ncbi:MAG TPA: tagaturonate epimerase family protein, partial [Aggregatilineales bacterium]|nr:tagaturonate epimerase family protein [Aggregatilineales bacterium]
MTPGIHTTSEVTEGGTRYFLAIVDDEKRLHVEGDRSGFVGHNGSFPLTADNARELRSRLSWLNPQPFGTKTSAGFGDRLGVATPGHIAAVRGTGVAPIFAQQSVRENTRTGRTPQQVLDDAMWSVFECGWRTGWGADADHMKTVENIQPFVDAVYSFYTIDPGDHVDDAADSDDIETLRGKVQHLDWATLDSSPDDLKTGYLQTFALSDRELAFDETRLLRAAVKYGNAVAHTVKMARYLETQMGTRGFDLEMSVDETETTTSLHEHFYIASELKRLGVAWVSMAPRFVGRFEKGVDYIGDLTELKANIAGHAAIMRYFGNSYKLSLHTGSDKFGVYPIAMQHTGGLVHLKTAGTSYLEALRVMANVHPGL